MKSKTTACTCASVTTVHAGNSLAFALAAAGFHALWNLLLARARDIEAAAAVALLTAEVVFLPVAVVVWQADAGVWPWLVGSGLLRARVLRAARGRVPASAALGRLPGRPRRGAGARARDRRGRARARHRAARSAASCSSSQACCSFEASRAPIRRLAFGVAIACCIAGYTLIDKSGIGHAAPITYLELSMVGPTIVYAGAVAARQGSGRDPAASRAGGDRAGIATFVAYAFVLAALERASAASVAAVRETSVVIAAGLAAVVLKEQVTRWRFLGAITVVAGIALLR